MLCASDDSDGSDVCSCWWASGDVKSLWRDAEVGYVEEMRGPCGEGRGIGGLWIVVDAFITYFIQY